MVIPRAYEEKRVYLSENKWAGSYSKECIASGPSGIDAKGWRRLCTSFKSASNDLCHSLTLLARRLSTTFVDPKGLLPLLACRLIALDKNLGVRPIGVCETAKRIIAKAILLVTRGDIQEAAGPL